MTLRAKDIANIFLVSTFYSEGPVKEDFVRDFIEVYAGSRLDDHHFWKFRHDSLGTACQFHLRGFSTRKPDLHGKGIDYDSFGIECFRYLSPDISISECRRSLALFLPSNNSGGRQLGNVYRIVYLTDPDGADLDSTNLNVSVSEIRLCRPGGGIAMLQRIIWAEIIKWTDDWRQVMDTIDSLVSFQVNTMDSIATLLRVSHQF